MAATCDGESKYYQYDTGTVIIVDVCSDLTGYTQAEFRVQKPEGGEVTWAATLVPGETTKLQYTVKSGDWDEAGIYKLQPYVAVPGWSGLGDTVQFQVQEKFT